MLALAGSGEYLPQMEAIDQILIEKLSTPARVVCLPTAAGTEGDAMVRSWSNKGLAHFTRLGVSVEALPIIDRASANYPPFVAAIRAANFVYLSGGNPIFLYQTLVDTAAWDAILSIREKGGVIAGCSAGAMIMGEKIVGMSRPIQGFNLLPGNYIIPHFNQFFARVEHLIGTLADSKLELIGIDNDTVLFIDGTHYEVFGAGAVTLYRGKNKQRYVRGIINDR